MEGIWSEHVTLTFDVADLKRLGVWPIMLKRREYEAKVKSGQQEKKG